MVTSKLDPLSRPIPSKLILPDFRGTSKKLGSMLPVTIPHQRSRKVTTSRRVTNPSIGQFPNCSTIAWITKYKGYTGNETLVQVRKALRRPALSGRGRRAGRARRGRQCRQHRGAQAWPPLTAPLPWGCLVNREGASCGVTEVSEGFCSGGAGEESAGAGPGTSHPLSAWRGGCALTAPLEAARGSGWGKRARPCGTASPSAAETRQATSGKHERRKGAEGAAFG